MKLKVNPTQAPENYTISQETKKKGKGLMLGLIHPMKMISIIHLTAGGLGRQSQQTVTHTV